MRGLSTFLTFSVLAVAIVASGCASAGPPPGTTAYNGMVWTWDEQENWVTLRQGARDIRVNVSPDQMVGLKLYETRTLYGTLAPPKDTSVIIQGQSTVVPRGPADEGEILGTVASVDPAGKIVVNTSQGPVQVWRATNGLPFAPGGNVRVRTRVQPLDVVIVLPGQAPPPAPVTVSLDPAASPRTEPGDYAVVMGRVLAVDPSGAITVESSRGPVTVRVPDASRYKVGDTVEVRTSVHPA
jgi:translation initiation factor IF-1